MKALFLLFLLGLLNNSGYSQAQTNIQDVRNVYDEKGDYYFDKKEFKKAIVYYNMAHKNDPGNYYSILRKAQAFSSLELYDQAAECYHIIFATNLYISNEYRLQYALVLFKNKDIKGFEEWMNKYNEIVNTEISKLNYISSAEIRAKMYKDSSLILVENENILNTAESEISPSVYQDKVLFASNRKNLSGGAGNDIYRIYTASYLDDGRLGRLNLFNADLNAVQNITSIAFSDKMHKLYFTQSSATGSKLKSYVASIPDNTDAKPEIKEFALEGFGNMGQIAFNDAGTKMYFVSDALGGSGGLDIYSCELANGKWSRPKNMGNAINSAKDEMYPFVLNDTLLYFSSAGHNGLGGLDLYVADLNQENSTPKNLGDKVNSEYDDYGLTFSPGGLTGYFCSNRPGGFGKEDIYRLHLLNIKVKYPAYKFRKKPTLEDDKINLCLSNGNEYNIASNGSSGFDFSFQPEEPYKIIIQHENPLLSNIIYNNKLTADQKDKEFLNPEPYEKTEIKLQAGMKYHFTAGTQSISSEYKNSLDEISKDYRNSGNDFNLTTLAKELTLKEGEIYTIQFVKDDDENSDIKTKEKSSLFINNVAVPVSGESFFIVLPLNSETNFNIQTDIAQFKETFNPKKVGTVKIDSTPVYKEVPVELSEGFPILVNTESLTDASQKKISATELSIIPGTMYILTFRRADAGAEDPGVDVPLTKGVKYNLGTENQSLSEYNKALSQMTSEQSTGSNSNEELIDISVLSKELDIMSEKNIVFTLMPVKQFVTQTSGVRNVLTTLSVDGRKYFITDRVKMEVNLNLVQNQKVNIQTDLAYVQENFVPSTISIKVDTTSIHKDLIEKKKSIITDPVYDVIVINYNLNDYSIRPEAKSLLAEKVIQVLKSDNRLYVTIKGYTDPLGDAAYNDKLSQNRAQTVKDFLISNGIGENRIRTFSYGESQALKEGVKWEDLSEEELQKYRKVEIVIYVPK